MAIKIKGDKKPEGFSDCNDHKVNSSKTVYGLMALSQEIICRDKKYIGLGSGTRKYRRLSKDKRVREICEGALVIYGEETFVFTDDVERRKRFNKEMKEFILEHYPHIKTFHQNGNITWRK